MDSAQASKSPVHRWKARFSLRTLMIAITVFGGVCAWSSLSSSRQRDARKMLLSLGARVEYEGERATPRTARRFTDWLGELASAFVDPDLVRPVTLVEMEPMYDVRTKNIELLQANDALVCALQFHRLQRLCLSYTDQSNEGLKLLTRLKCLESLDVSHTLIREGPVPGLESLHLQSFCADDTRFDDDGVASLADMKTLKVVSLEGTRVSDAGLDQLRNLPNLRSLFIGQTQVTAEGYEAFCRARPEVDVCWHRRN